MIAARRLQRTFADGLIAEAVEDLWEPWMRYADQALEDEALLLIIQQELAKRYKKSKTRGRPATTAEVVLRMMLLKHARDWSYADLTREVRANLVYRQFTKIGGGKVPDDKTVGRLGGSGANLQVCEIRWVLLCEMEIGSGYAARAACQISGIVAVSPPSLLM